MSGHWTNSGQPLVVVQCGKGQISGHSGHTPLGVSSVQSLTGVDIFN